GGAGRLCPCRGSALGKNRPGQRHQARLITRYVPRFGISMKYDLIQLETVDTVATITLNRPEKRNAMSDDMRTEFIDALEYVAADKAIKALVLTGAGKGFC